MEDRRNMEEKIIKFDPWYGELGWEVMSWAPFCRNEAKKYDKAIITSFPEMAPLYTDFAEFRSHGSDNRTLNYVKRYRVKEGIFRKYGVPNNKYDILIHNRGVRRKSDINYRYFDKVTPLLKYFEVACIGGLKDNTIQGVEDRRGINLQELMDYMAGCKVVVGVSSGVMHLAAACGANIVTWADDRTYYNETLEKRYKETWNPFNVEVGFITVKDYQPNPKKIVEEIEKLI